ncbi:unnamed protein product [marine sediment metagenome]|uniref:Uncharacterized protein n=1 Tax=marine sediment metagenome TaxID=412755 RepID=X1J6Z2_9ZZZZ
MRHDADFDMLKRLGWLRKPFADMNAIQLQDKYNEEIDNIIAWDKAND